jgi:hypothetical protein
MMQKIPKTVTGTRVNNYKDFVLSNLNTRGLKIKRNYFNNARIVVKYFKVAIS